MPDRPATSTDFPVIRKGYDPAAVRSYLSSIDAHHETLERHIADLEAQLTVASTPVIDEAVVAQFLGAETAQLLTRAHDTARELSTSADRKATQTLNEANNDAARMRREAHQDSERLRKETEADCAAKVEAAEERAFQLIKDAEEQRKAILADVARRRDRASLQLEELMAGRDRLVDSIAVLRHEADEITGDLSDFRLEAVPFSNLAPTFEPTETDIADAATSIARGKASASS
jgi:cell division septum initiation protein DivIVA